MQSDNFENLRQLLRLKAYSPKTISSYVYYNTAFLNFANKSARQITGQNIKDYLLFLVDKGVSSATVNLAYNALKFYYHHFYKRRFFVDIPRAKKDKKLPVVLSKREVQRMIEVTDNLKHKFLIQFLYSTGIRVSEVVKIKMSYIDFDRKLVLIRNGKGKKDRYTLLADLLISTLKEQRKIKVRDKYLFTGRDRKKHLNVMSVQKVVKAAAEKAGLAKNVSAHTLRHSFATHLLEQGTDIRYIQELLGHRRLETTQIYTKVSNKNLSDIKNPLDS